MLSRSVRKDGEFILCAPKGLWAMRYDRQSSILMAPLMDPSPLSALSPVDGRYAAASEPLRRFFTEAALIRERVQVEALWFLALAAPALHMTSQPISESVLACARQLAASPPPDAPQSVKLIEARINHDVKAVEYFVRDALAAAGADEAVLELVHFGCTSEDINNLSYARLLRDARDTVLLPE